MARPSKYTPERVETVLTALRAGNTRTASSGYAEIDYSTFTLWLSRYPEFFSKVKKAESDAEVAMVANIRKAVNDGTWTAAAWWLERRRHADWINRARLEHSGPGGGPVEIKQITVYLPSAEKDDADEDPPQAD